MDHLARDDYIQQHAREAGLKEGLKKVREEGERYGSTQIAKKLLSYGMSNEAVAQVTGLSICEINMHQIHPFNGEC